ncbi:MFS transporter [Streptomyces sp. NPDC017082]|uniref:MFS transporter n=1 Tax=Streptomyces sp. NPDC017082 TaxID=3364974 RepID=UPI0037A63A8B
MHEAAGRLICALGDSYGWVAAGRVVAALGAASYTPQASAAASLVSEERRGRALGIVIGGLILATALGVPIGTWIGGLAGWRATLWAVAALGAVGLLGVSMLPRLAPAGRHPLAERLSGLRNPAVLITLTVTLLAVTSEHVVYTYIGPLLHDATHGGRALSVPLFVFGVGAVAGNAIAGSATDRLGNRVVLLLAVGGTAVDLALLPLWSGSLAGAGVALFVWGATGWMYLVPQQHRLLSLSEASGPFTVALNSSALYLGIAIGGAVGGLLVNTRGPEWTAVPAFVLAALAYGRPTPTGPTRETRSDPARQGVSDDE